jgi:hypothetical protein
MGQRAARSASEGDDGAEPVSHRAPRVCAACGRSFAWRRAWARDWEQIRFCSAGCRAHRPGPVDVALETRILDLLAQRARGATLCPSEAARAVAPEAWRPLMERTRRAARRLVAAGHIDIVQKGRVVDPSTARGPIRLRRRSGR